LIEARHSVGFDGTSYDDFCKLTITPSQAVIQENMISAVDALLWSSYFRPGNFHHFGISGPGDCLQEVPDRSMILMCRFRDGELERTIEQCAENLKSRYIIVQTLIGDDGFVSQDILNSLPENVVRIYSKNVQINDSRLIPIPIGRDWRVTEEGFDSVFIRRADAPLENFAYMNFSLATNPIRELVYRRFSNETWVTTLKPEQYGVYEISHSAFSKQMSRHTFTFSPIGKAVDCYRSWDALYCKSIPVLDRTPHSSVYDELPVLIIDDWSTLDRETLEKEFTRIRSARFNLRKVTSEYWKQIIAQDAEANF